MQSRWQTLGRTALASLLALSCSSEGTSPNPNDTDAGIGGSSSEPDVPASNINSEPESSAPSDPVTDNTTEEDPSAADPTGPDGVAGDGNSSATTSGGSATEGGSSGFTTGAGGEAGAGGAVGVAGAGGNGGTPPEPVPTTGTIPLTLTADNAAAASDVVSLGVTFPPGALYDATSLLLRDAAGNEVPAFSSSLALWPSDGSQRSVLLAFRATLAAGSSENWTIEYGAARNLPAEELAPNPDGPVAAILDARWYATSRAIGFSVAAADNSAFPDWESGTEDYLASMDPPWDSYGLSCDNTSAERSYYDGPHALFQRFIHYASADSYRRARLEANWYRDNELSWYEANEVAVYSCATWDPESPLDWGSLRRMLGQGMLDDYLLTGDPLARAALAGLGEAFLRNLPALTGGNEITVLVTERNMAWPLMGLASYYAIDQRADVEAALEQLVQLTIDWQAAGSSGAFEHDINRPDPEECGDGPAGASPFMTSLLVDGLMDAHFLLADPRLSAVVVQVAEWYRDEALTSDGVAFEYLWGCNDVDYDDSGVADLNLLISHVFGAAYYMSNDPAWLDFGDTMANHGVENLYAGAPKQYSQSTRTFIKYMGYRALDRTP